MISDPWVNQKVPTLQAGKCGESSASHSKLLVGLAWNHHLRALLLGESGYAPTPGAVSRAGIFRFKGENSTGFISQVLLNSRLPNLSSYVFLAWSPPKRMKVPSGAHASREGSQYGSRPISGHPTASIYLGWAARCKEHRRVARCVNRLFFNDSSNRLRKRSALGPPGCHRQ